LTVFWAGTAVLVALALAFVLRPLLSARNASSAGRLRANVDIYRDQLRELDADLASGMLAPEQHAQARKELEARLLEDTTDQESARAQVKPARYTACALSVLLPLGALCVYLLVGAPAVLDPRILAAADAEHTIDRAQLEAMVDKLAARLKEEPENGEGWLMLARSYRHFQRYEDAARAYGNAVSRLPPDAGLLADYADVLAAAQGRLTGEPEELIAKAIDLDPKNLKALALAGSAAFEQKRYAQAAASWERMLPLVDAGSEQARVIQDNVAEAKALGGIAGAKTGAATAPAQAAAETAKVPAPAALSGVVSLAPELAAKVSPDDFVLIYARAAEGSRMPLAIVRKQVRELPVRFALDDTMAMQPEMKLSKHASVIVAARVSKSSSATPQPGDLQGASAPVPNTASGVKVVIDREIR
jgi:cytochrome c-type biogenesis protein CcmH